MPDRRIETTTSRTAEMTCLIRACSYLEADPYYRSDDGLAQELLPLQMRLAARVPPARRAFRNAMSKSGIFQYVAARTRYIDAAMRAALADGFEQVLVLGAGFDTRALRLAGDAMHARVYEVDAAPTQAAKVAQYRKRGLTVPGNLVFVAMDFDRESLPERLVQSCFARGGRSLVIMEGLLMYLQPESAEALLGDLQSLTGRGSRFVFDYVLASVVRGAGTSADGADAARAVASVNEKWRFGLDRAALPAFLARFGLAPVDVRDARALEALYFVDASGATVGHVNDGHCLVTAERL